MGHGLTLQLIILGGNGRQRFYFDIEYLTHMPPLIVISPQCSAIAREEAWAYEERVGEIEHGSFAPLVFCISGPYTKE